MKTLIAASLVAAALSVSPAAAAPQTAHGHEFRASSPAATLRENMRALWADHVIRTRDYIVAAVGDQPDQQAAAARLMKNQEDIGAAMAVYYGQPAGAKLTELLKGHIAIAVDLIKAAKAGDKVATDEVVARLTKNWDADVRAFDAVYHHILTMSDALSDGIVKQFPDKF
jgi:hypothetical protein